MSTLLVAWFVISAFNVIYGFLRARELGFGWTTVSDGYWQGVFTAGLVSLVVAGFAAMFAVVGVIH